MRLGRLYPVVDVGSLRTLGIALDRFVQELAGGGAEILQLRDKQGAPNEVLRNAEMISALLDGTECLPVMNDRVDLALLAGWDAAHLGQGDLPIEAARRVHPGLKMVGLSTHDEGQVQAAEAGLADYVAIGPVFGTMSKQDAEPPVGLEGVRRVRALTRKPLVAIGGITRQNCAAVVEAGADAVAVIGALFAEGESVGAVVQDFLRRLR